MHANVLAWLRFYYSRMSRRYPFALASAVLLLAAFAAAGIWLLSMARHESLVLRDIANASRALSQAASAPAQQGTGSIDLPRFEPNKMVEAINRLAVNTKLPLDEVSFVLDDNRNLPYLRYRITLSVSTRYPAIKHFLDALQTDQPELALDAISCERDDITAADTSCDVNLSAFYRRPEHG